MYRHGQPNPDSHSMRVRISLPMSVINNEFYEIYELKISHLEACCHQWHQTCAQKSRMLRGQSSVVITCKLGVIREMIRYV